VPSASSSLSLPRYIEAYDVAERYGLEYLVIIEDVCGLNSEHMAIPLINIVKLYDEMNKKDGSRTTLAKSRLKQLNKLAAKHPGVCVCECECIYECVCICVCVCVCV
jgi:hypothetical protein